MRVECRYLIGSVIVDRFNNINDVDMSTDLDFLILIGSDDVEYYINKTILASIKIIK